MADAKVPDTIEWGGYSLERISFVAETAARFEAARMGAGFQDDPRASIQHAEALWAELCMHFGEEE